MKGFASFLIVLAFVLALGFALWNLTAALINPFL